ncbi:RNA polymerase II elongator complex subunit [Lasiosphaeris hirsuta]|uniref:RNA polymerase II elongator complex subunit n=1 Tax=Lasiosphaeris hirsuta TaxID=260670 RepID=A0AA40A9B6_9PEZI|nr:RNA polymerase II elongator complex subunit [Lasiosphaeris hirsuta]
MPLIIITGLPTSGKSTRAQQLHAYLADRIATETPPNSQPKYRLHLISDQTQGISRAVYDLSPEHLPAHVRSANASEKDARAALYGAVKRVLSPRDIVVLDGLNYIKGWRYQLFCEAKNMSTPSAVLQIGCPVDRAREVNEARLARRGAASPPPPQSPLSPAPAATAETNNNPPPTQALEPAPEPLPQTEPSLPQPPPATGDDDDEPYSPSNWTNLVFRYEEPNPMTRWDSPLFALVWDDGLEQTRTVFAALWDVVAGVAARPVRPNQSTVHRDKDPGGDYLYVLERETQDIVKRILEGQQTDDGGGEVTMARVNGGGEGEQLVVELPPSRKVGLPQLQRYRRAFVALNRGGIGLEAVGKLAAGRLRESFVGYLNDAFERDG